MFEAIKEWWYVREYKERRWFYERKTGYPKTYFNGDETFGERIIFYLEVIAAELVILSPLIIFVIGPFVATSSCN